MNPVTRIWLVLPLMALATSLFLAGCGGPKVERTAPEGSAPPNGQQSNVQKGMRPMLRTD